MFPIYLESRNTGFPHLWHTSFRIYKHFSFEWSELKSRKSTDASKVLWKRSLSALLDRSVYSEKWFQYMEYRPKCEFIMFQPVVDHQKFIFQTILPCHSNPQTISHWSGRNLSYDTLNFQTSKKVLWKRSCASVKVRFILTSFVLNSNRN